MSSSWTVKMCLRKDSTSVNCPLQLPHSKMPSLSFAMWWPPLTCSSFLLGDCSTELWFFLFKMSSRTLVDLCSLLTIITATFFSWDCAAKFKFWLSSFGDSASILTWSARLSPPVKIVGLSKQITSPSSSNGFSAKSSCLDEALRAFLMDAVSGLKFRSFTSSCWSTFLFFTVGSGSRTRPARDPVHISACMLKAILLKNILGQFGHGL